MSLVGPVSKSRGREPPAYDGSKEFKDWKISFFAWLALENIRYIELTDIYPTHVREYGRPLTDAELTSTYDTASMEANDKVLRLNKRLYFYLVSYTEGTPRLMINAVKNYNGLEAYRVLCQRYDKTKDNEALSAMYKITTMKVSENDYEGNLNAWEREVELYERAVGQVMTDKHKTTLLINAITGKMKDYIVLQYSDNMTYTVVRGIVMNYAKARTVYHQGPAPMDIGQFGEEDEYVAAFKGKGKSKGKGKGKFGKGKSKGKGKGKMPMKGKSKGKDGKGVPVCHNCGRPGHYARDCRYRDGQQQQGWVRRFDEEYDEQYDEVYYDSSWYDDSWISYDDSYWPAYDQADMINDQSTPYLALTNGVPGVQGIHNFPAEFSQTVSSLGSPSVSNSASTAGRTDPSGITPSAMPSISSASCPM